RLLAIGCVSIVGPPAGEAAADGMELADPAVAHQLAGPAEVLVGSLLASGLEDALVFMHRIAHGASLGYCELERLLAIDVLAGVCRGDRRKGVPVIGRGYLHRIDIFPSKELSKIGQGIAAFVCTGSLLLRVSRLHPFFGRISPANSAVPVTHALLVHVAHREDLDALIVKEYFQVVDALVAGTD